jgi:hypothetical protein
MAKDVLLDDGKALPAPSGLPTTSLVDAQRQALA